jgi:hypothetical protein
VDYAELLTSTPGEPIDSRPAKPASGLDIPKPLLDLWDAHGWAGYGNGLFWTTDPADFVDVLKDFRPEIDGLVIGRGAFADLFILDGADVFQLDPRRDELRNVAPTLDLFFQACVGDKDFRRDYMLGKLLKRAIAQAGRLQHDECYGFFPAAALGGSEDIKSLKRVKLLEHLAILAQLHG